MEMKLSARKVGVNERGKKWMKGQTKREEEEEKTIKKEKKRRRRRRRRKDTQKGGPLFSVCGARSSSSFADYHPFVMWMETAIALLSPKGIFRGVFSTGVD
jgi:hypothetical protein